MESNIASTSVSNTTYPPPVVAEAEVQEVEIEVHDETAEIWITLRATHAGKEHSLQLAESDRVYDLKVALANLTNVPPERQKILGLSKGKLPPDECRLDSMKLTNGKKFTLVGTPQGHEFKDPSELEDLPDVYNDLDVDFTLNPAAAAAYINDVRNQRKVREATKKLKVDLMNPLRSQRLLVLDLDYTILDTKPLTTQALPPAECARPHLHEFLEKVYPYYDICIWSQTSWIWLETKLVELGMVGAETPHTYKIGFVLDKTSMFTVFSTRNGEQYKHSVKPLKIIWNHFKQYSAKNTIHVDDLGRNFALNPHEGLKIPAFKDCHTLSAGQDTELLKVADYLVRIATVPDFRQVDHKNWKNP